MISQYIRRQRTNFLFLNLGHFLDHFFMLIFATAAAVKLTQEWGLTYAELIPYATPGFIAFGLFSIPAGWLADKWSREGMMLVFFIGIGISSIVTGLANNPLQIGMCLAIVGVFAAIYHPVGLAMVVEGRDKTGIPLAINGIYGNMGVASAALLTGFLIDNTGWRSAFYLSGLISVVIGGLYFIFLRSERKTTLETSTNATRKNAAESTNLPRRSLFVIFAIILFTTAVGGLVFQSTTFALPKVFEERLTDLAGSATMVGWYAFIVFTVAAFAQLAVGYLVDRYPLHRVFATVALLQAVFFTLMIPASGFIALLVATGFMLAVFGQIPINDVLIGRISKSEWRSRAFALRYVVTFSVAATAVPLISWIHGVWGFSRLFILLAVAAFTIFLAACYLSRTAISR